MKLKNIIKATVATVMAFTMSVTALAVNDSTSITLTVNAADTPAVVQVKVPSTIPLTMNEQGAVQTTGGLKIENLSSEVPVKVTAITVTGNNGWSIADYNTNITGEANDTKKLGLWLNGATTSNGGSVNVVSDNWQIQPSSSIGLTVNAKIPKQTKSTSATNIANINWTFEANGATVVEPEDKLTDYYSFSYDSTTSGLKASLTSGFKNALNSASPSSYGKWTPGTALPALPAAYNGQNVTSIEGMFSNMTQMTSVDITSFDATNWKSVKDAFKGDTALKTVRMNNLKTSNVTDWSGLYSQCNSLTDIYMTGCDMSAARTTASMYSGCESLTSIDTSIYNFRNVEDVSYMYSQCTNLSNLDMSNVVMSRPSRIEYWYQNCRSLQSLDLRNVNVESVTDYNSVFYGMSGLKSLNVSTWNTVAMTKADYMLNGCSSLTEIDFSSFTFNSASAINMLSSCDAVTTAYAKDEETCEFLNSLPSKPDNITFTTKS